MISLRGAVIALLSSLFAADQSGPVREHFEHATVLYDFVTNQRGQKLRTFITRPTLAATDADKKVPVIFFVGWLSCDTMESPNPAPDDGFGIFLRRLIDESGYATVRMDKPGIGDSEGDCAKADFSDEISGWQAAFDALSKYDFMDLSRVFVVGLSNGGGFSPVVVRDRPVRGFVSCGSWGRTWYEHMLELERRRLIESGRTSSEVNAQVKAFVEFYTLYLIKGMTPGQVIAQHPEWKDLWYDSTDGQYGRPAAFYQQLQSLNLGETWQKVTAPVLVIRGASDSIMSRNDSEAIVQIVNQAHPGHGRYLEIEGMAHQMTVKGKFYDALVPTVMEWMRQQSASKQ